ncbi:hypothetical protein MTP99_009279 [Tenebrio molitor]|nr:hypothetical protein MTP99_009279 [Tenebrio molitor]
MSTKNKSISFTKFERQLKIPFVIYVHFEAFRKPTTKSKESFVHEPCGFGYSVKCLYDNSLSKYEDFYGEECVEVFWKKIEVEANHISEKLKSRPELSSLNLEQKHQLDNEKRCYYCDEELKDDSHAYHYELTGEFVGVVHKACKLQAKLPDFIPVVLHNQSKFGVHFLLKDYSNSREFVFFDGDNEAKFGFKRNFQNRIKLQFIYSHLLMDESIEKLGDILSDSKKYSLKEQFPLEENFNLMKTKNSFPHDHINSFEQFSEDSFPKKDGFYDRLHDEQISDANYRRSEQIWSTFNCRTIGDYFKLYLTSNVLLLQDIFENFRSFILEKYRLDPAHYFTIASLSWEAMLKYSKLELEVLQDKEIIDFIKLNIRGGLLQCSKRFAKANNQYCPGYDGNKPSTFIIYLDANNLAGYAMSQCLPFSEFSWLTEAQIKVVRQNIHKFTGDDEYGYILEVDLDYPQSLHKLHNDLPFCQKKLKVPPESTDSQIKPVLALYNKSKYVTHYMNLQQCLKNGLVLKNIHRVLKFKQCKWLEPYVAYNTKLRANASNDFEKKLYKLFNNTIYGKTIEKSRTDRPIYAGFSILELSKKCMYDFHYNHMLSKYKDKINLLYTDTDSLVYEIETEDLYRDIKLDSNFSELLDTSNIDSRWGIPPKNKNMLGKMKDEYGGKVIRAFYGVGAKVYCLELEDEVIKKGSSVKTYVKRKYLSQYDYENCVLNDAVIKKKYFITTISDHNVETTQMTRTVLSPGDVKRFVLPDKINTLAWGYQGE